MSSRPGVSGIVLAGGRSERYGTDKLAALIDGVTLLGRAVAAVAAAADEVIVVTSPMAGPPALVGEAGVSVARPVRLVRDPEPYAGPFVGLATGLAAVAHPVALVVAGDMPWLDPDVLHLLVAELVASDVAAAAALEAADGVDGAQRLERFPVALRVAAASPIVERLVTAGERRLSALMDALAVRTIPAGTWLALDPDGLTARDVDRVEDLRRATPRIEETRGGEVR